MTNTKKAADIITFEYIFNIFIKNKVFFAISLFFAVSLAYFINKTSQPVYQVSTSLVINESKNGITDASSQLLQELGFSSVSKNFANELIVINSYPIINEAIKKLNFQISYFEENSFSEKELYKSTPFVIILNQNYPQIVDCPLYLEILNEKEFRIYIDAGETQVYSFVSDQITQVLPYIYEYKAGKFNSDFRSEFYDFKVIMNNDFDFNSLETNKTYFFVINKPSSLIRKYQSILEINPPDLESTVAAISLKSTVPEKEIDFLNSLTETYIYRDIAKKRHGAFKTIEYIDNQLNTVKESLDVAEINLQQFRARNQVIDVSMQAQRVIDEMNRLKNEKAQWEIKSKYVDYIEDYFNKNQEYSDLVTPSAMGIDDPLLNNLINELITLNTERSNFIESNQEKSPYLKKILVRIDNLKNMISENIKYIKKTTSISVNDVDSRIRQMESEIQKMPITERELTGIKRIFNINDAIYTFLLEKKSEAEIAKASYQPDAEILQPADVMGMVAPRKKMNYIIALLLGIIFPLTSIQIFKSVRKVLVDPEEITRISNFPILGKIYHNNKKTEMVVEEFPKSHITESFRKLRVNLNYFLSNNKSSKVLSINSSISGEGKSFISLNFATLLAKDGFRTILIGFDIRKPKKYDMIESFPELGLTTYLSDQASIDDITIQTKNHNLHIITAGPIPPNPSELLMSPKVDEFLEYLKENYEYIIIDTAPMDVVTDAHILVEKVDLNVFITRLKHTPKKNFESVVSELAANKIKTCLVINDIPVMKKTKYGYGYYDNSKS